MMKFGRQIFFTRGLYKGPGTFVGPSRDLPDIFLWNIGQYFSISSAHHFWHIPRENDKIWSKIFFPRWFHRRPWTFLGTFRVSLTVFIKYWSYNPNFYGHGFSAENNKIMMEFCAMPFTQLLSNYRVDDELYESPRSKPGWRFTAGV